MERLPPGEVSVERGWLRGQPELMCEGVIEDDMAAEPQPSPAVTDCEEGQIELIPMGCAGLRISCFPIVTANEAEGTRWKAAPAHTEPATGEQKHDWPYSMQEKA
ncbi:MAG: hypothetical protein E7620_04445 [Ruminococcaceae bacterium]|nr:hypothetical protein [Oscillospiraceae bacterium]